MQAIMLIKQPEPEEPGKTDHGDHGHPAEYRCISPFLGAYVAFGIIAVCWAGWALLSKVLG